MLWVDGIAFFIFLEPYVIHLSVELKLVRRKMGRLGWTRVVCMVIIPAQSARIMMGFDI